MHLPRLLAQLIMIMVIVGLSCVAARGETAAVFALAEAASGAIDPVDSETAGQPRLYSRTHELPPPGLSIDPYVRPELAARFDQLHPLILQTAARHNRPALSGMSDTQFAAVLTLILLNEQNGWFEDQFEPVRVFTPLYQRLQREANRYGRAGGNFSVWPTNLRPSVALEILQQRLPVPGPERSVRVPVHVSGTHVDPAQYATRAELYAALTAEISRDDMAIEFLGANLARGLYRAEYEGVPVSWRTLAAWHNQGIVDPEQIRANPVAADYVRRASAYLPLAQRLVNSEQRLTP